ncbi:hypothetical protein BU14_0197s0011 [Porphyra umbilicalis]|uniref:Uncharacterized protein n=1 Tax=Porphyra umbilicalis TaxID=2786 RepID=A0A1X6P6E2_PORUM|nr:hypothetical protein BU14_0197s0011 [Porphyra umbilicalis]|eukprot:OSX76315.1 hypothetical protein BU14_0197s0011 [Porphyra umbilicalis]
MGGCACTGAARARVDSGGGAPAEGAHGAARGWARQTRRRVFVEAPAAAMHPRLRRVLQPFTPSPLLAVVPYPPPLCTHPTSSWADTLIARILVPPACGCFTPSLPPPYPTSLTPPPRPPSPPSPCPLNAAPPTMGTTLSVLVADVDDAVDVAAVLPPDSWALFDAATAANTAVNAADSASVSTHLRLQELFAASAVVYDSRAEADRLLEWDDWADVAGREGPRPRAASVRGGGGGGGGRLPARRRRAGAVWLAEGRAGAEAPPPGGRTVSFAF